MVYCFWVKQWFKIELKYFSFRFCRNCWHSSILQFSRHGPPMPRYLVSWSRSNVPFLHLHLFWRWMQCCWDSATLSEPPPHFSSSSSHELLFFLVDDKLMLAIFIGCWKETVHSPWIFLLVKRHYSLTVYNLPFFIFSSKGYHIDWKVGEGERISMSKLYIHTYTHTNWYEIVLGVWTIGINLM